MDPEENKAPIEGAENTDQGPEANNTNPAPEVQLYKLPDGREVDANTLYNEHVNNLLPEFTRRSQKLAEYEKNTTNNQPEEKKEAQPWEKPDWVPSSYKEILDIATQEAMRNISLAEQSKSQAYQEAQAEVDSTIAELQKADPSLNTEALFVHANKYQFSDLKLAYENMKAMGAVVKTAEAQAAKNISARAADPVATTSGNAATGGGADINQLRGNFSAADLLSIFGKK